MQHQPPPGKASLPSYVPTTPFPSRLVHTKHDSKMDNLLECFKKKVANIPLLDALRSVPYHATTLKEASMRKRKLKRVEMSDLIDECGEWLKEDLPLKKKDPGSFSIPMKIGKTSFERVLCDSGASINLMPYTIYRKLKLGDLNEAKMNIQLFDGSCLKPHGIVEDVLVKVQDFIFPADFVVVDMPKDPKMPLILGRPFLATCEVEQDLKSGTMTFWIGDKKIMFRSSPPQLMPQCDDVYLAESFMGDLFEEKDSVVERPKIKPPKPKDVHIEILMALQHSGGFSTAPTPKRKRMKFRIFWRKNVKEAMTLEIIPVKNAAAAVHIPKGQKSYAWLECCFQPP